MFTVGEKAWHNLDVNMQGPRLTAEEAQAYLNWRVKKEQATRDGKPVDGAFYTIREDTDAVLGVVGSQYAIIQNSWLFRLLNPVVEDGACIYETGGSLMGGRKVWALAKLPDEHYIVKDDKVNQYILITIAHDGSMMFTAMHTAIRVVCNNTLTAALSLGGGQHPVVRIKHTPGYQFQIQIAHQILGLSTKASAQAATFFAAMAAKAMNTVELTKFAKYLFPSVREIAGKDADARIQELRNQLYIGFEADINNVDPEHRHTAWSAYDAYTDILDHGKPARKGTDRTSWSLYGPGQDKRLHAINWLKALMGFQTLPEPDETPLLAATVGDYREEEA
jgi:phage/plasmid-like protein (TIGR03299 family)